MVRLLWYVFCAKAFEAFGTRLLIKLALRVRTLVEGSIRLSHLPQHKIATVAFLSDLASTVEIVIIITTCQAGEPTVVPDRTTECSELRQPNGAILAICRCQYTFSPLSEQTQKGPFPGVQKSGSEANTESITMGEMFLYSNI